MCALELKMVETHVYPWRSCRWCLFTQKHMRRERGSYDRSRPPSHTTPNNGASPLCQTQASSAYTLGCGHTMLTCLCEANPLLFLRLTPEARTSAPSPHPHQGIYTSQAGERRVAAPTICAGLCLASGRPVSVLSSKALKLPLHPG